ncbi:nitrate- and nitrite sensing domain-containing protein [Nocardia sp. NPDC127526]|uniref:sensor histidine kinase n=1 Tax=Nocardia sp. NPDC127526 TaxID=3345393 RepID=UPI00362B6873
MLRRRLGVRIRILAIALVPSLALVVIGVGAAGALVDRSDEARTWADELQAGIAPTREIIEAVQAERRISVWHTVGAEPDIRTLTAARLRLDTALRLLAPAQSRLSSIGPEEMGDATAAFSALGNRLTGIRAGIDGGTLPIAEADAFYSQMPALVAAGTEIAQQTAPDAATATELSDASEVLRGLESMSRATALGAALATETGLTPELSAEFIRLVGYYRTRIERMVVDTDPGQVAAVQALVTGGAWQRTGAMETVLAQRALPRPAGAGAPESELPMTVGEWQSAADEVNRALAELWQSQSAHAQRLASDAASETTRKSLWAGAGMLVIALGAILVALALANRIIRRLTRLRNETFALADEQLPETMRRLSAGEAVDIRAETPPLDFGNDEIGQVAKAFNHAHEAAVSAAVTESRTREGVKAVFLNIAHRSQVVVHKQLELLDEAESRQEDPALLDIFFRLDHLATRERRNAENLVILAGGRPGRQWRNPVPLLELVRSAVGETIDYKRVRTGRLPEVFVVGLAVGDLIHLLAELIDNATAFSPPQSQVSITGHTVGRGVALEISDQGMGMPDPDLLRVNALLATPADFGVTTLSEDSRLGLFVVSLLAERHGIAVKLAESDYGGIRAIVLIPAALIPGEFAPADYDSEQLAIGRRAAARAAAERAAEAARAADSPHTTEFFPATGESPGRYAEQPALPAAPIPDSGPGGADRRARDRPRPAAYPTSDATTYEAAAPHPHSGEPKQLGGHTPQGSTPEAPQSRPHNGTGDGTRPVLPRRRRQENLAPELAHDPRPQADAPPTTVQRSAEQARDLMSAIEIGTRQGRQADVGGFSPNDYRQEGDGEQFTRR